MATKYDIHGHVSPEGWMYFDRVKNGLGSIRDDFGTWWVAHVEKGISIAVFSGIQDGVESELVTVHSLVLFGGFFFA